MNYKIKFNNNFNINCFKQMSKIKIKLMFNYKMN